MGIQITETAVATGSKKVANDYYINHFKKQGKDIEKLLNHVGRTERFTIGGKNETTITLAAKAVDKLLSKANLTGKDIDIIVVTSQFPEFTVPSQSVLIHKHIKGKTECMVLDMNANCLGMLNGLDILNSYLTSRADYSRAILVGADVMSKHCKDTDEYTYPLFGDGACAMLIEKTEKEIGVIGASHRTESEEAYQCLFPECGLSTIAKHIGDANKMSWLPPNAEPMPYSAREALEDILAQHSYKLSDIDWLCGSQYTLPMLKKSSELCEIPWEKTIYVGDKYGYTGTSSPFISFHEGRKDGRIKTGDLVLFWTVGIGYSVCAMLFKV